MENFALEIVETINEHYYRDGTEGKELIKDMLFYLYHTTNDDKLKEAILDWLYKTTPEGAYLVAKGDVENEYSDEIICNVRDDSVVNYTIKEEQTNA